MAQLTEQEKQDIRQSLTTYSARYASQAKAANSLKGVTSPGTFNAVVNGKFDKISDDMLLKIRAAVSSSCPTEGWKVCETTSFREMETLFDDAQRFRNVTWITGPAGIGKTTAAREYASSHRNVFVLQCSEDMHKADFVDELATLIGLRTGGLTVRETLAGIVDELVRMDNPLLVFDEGDKLADPVMHYFIGLYNALEDKCGMVFLSTKYIERRISIGLRYGRKGYEELYSRLGRRFVPLSPVTAAEIAAICRANGLTDEKAVASVVGEAGDAWSGKGEFDLRRVKKSVHKRLRIAAARN